VCTASLEQFKFNDAAMHVYDFTWHSFCDWYLEIVKARLYEPVNLRDKKVAQTVLAKVFDQILHLLHPFVPFITEELWHNLKRIVLENKIDIQKDMRCESLARSVWPTIDKRYEDRIAEETMTILQNIIRAIRNIRSKMNIKEKQKLDALISISADGEYNLQEHSGMLKRMANLERLEIGKNLAKPDNAASEVIGQINLSDGRDLSEGLIIGGQIQVFVPLEGIIDPVAEKERQLKHLSQLENHLAVVRRKLDNKDFAARAPAHVVAMEQNREKELLEQIQKIKLILNDLG